MQALISASLIFLLISVAWGCPDFPNEPTRSSVIQQICKLQDQVTNLYESVLHHWNDESELVGYPDSLSNVAPTLVKRKNEFIRFGKRSTDMPSKRKNEFIRFGKRKNEFIRFGRSLSPFQQDDVNAMVKRKNEFIRFG